MRARTAQKAAGRTTCEPLYDVDPRTGATIEVFYADEALAGCFGMSSAGWLWWSCRDGRFSNASPARPFATSYGAYRDALGCGNRLFAK